jgi:hypothetical protein
VAKIYGYVHVSDGVHPGDNIFGCERAKPQIQLLQEFAEFRDETLTIFFDYKRTVKKLDDLAVLHRTLEKLKKDGGNGCLVVECLARLAQKPQFSHRNAFMRELMTYGTHLYGLRQKRRLSEFDDGHRLILQIGPPPKRPTQRGPARVRDTKPMTMASSSSRRTRSEQDSRRLEKVRKELLDQGRPATLEAIAAEANARGHRNQRGNDWTAAAVSARLAALDADNA